jgi:hypothetical protein
VIASLAFMTTSMFAAFSAAVLLAACQPTVTGFGPGADAASTASATAAAEVPTVPPAPTVALAVASPARPAPGTGQGPAVSVPDALGTTVAGPLLVNGFLVVTGPEVTLCEQLAESYPPQCGGARVEVQGLDVNAVPGLETADETRWTPAPVQVLGEVREGVLYAQVLGQP